MLWNLPPQLRNATEARHVSEVSLNGGLERPLHEDVQLKPRLPWRPQEVGDVRGVGHLSKKLLTGSGTSPREKLKGVGDLKSALA